MDSAETVIFSACPQRSRPSAIGLASGTCRAGLRGGRARPVEYSLEQFTAFKRPGVGFIKQQLLPRSLFDRACPVEFPDLPARALRGRRVALVQARQAGGNPIQQGLPHNGYSRFGGVGQARKNLCCDPPYRPTETRNWLNLGLLLRLFLKFRKRIFMNNPASFL